MESKSVTSYYDGIPVVPKRLGRCDDEAWYNAWTMLPHCYLRENAEAKEQREEGQCNAEQNRSFRNVIMVTRGLL